ncbi:divalent-cation tolerance protein CutA [Haematobia irritans]|uniref:divalent-cation tolerance protein CutA n=1 Tax=Haematobia irritans TaxID=7368 RepID=UPI003F5080B2
MHFLRNLFITTSYLLVARKAIPISGHLNSNSLPPSFCTKVSTDSLSKSNMDNEFKYESGTASVAFVTAPDEKIAKKLAHGLLEQKLAACINIIPSIQSIYMWEGKVNEDIEYLMIIKTQTGHVDELTKWVRANHPYSVAEVITLPIEKGNPPYMKWLKESVPEKN